MRMNTVWTVAACLAAVMGCSTEQPRQPRAAAAVELAGPPGDYAQRTVRTLEHERRVLDRASSWEGGGLRPVTMVDHMRLYRTPGGATVVLRSTPDVRGHDRASLPSADPEAVVELVSAPFTQDLPASPPLERYDTWQTQVLDQPARVTTFVPANDSRWRLHLVKVRSADDVVAALALLPAATPRAEVASLLAAVEHDTER